MKSSYASSVTLLAALAAAEVIQVQVGPGLSYSPDSVTANEGDVVSFTFGSGHDVVSGSFDSPCQPSGGIYSGEPGDGDVFSVTVNGTDPVWIYCSVPHHCQGGMAMVINPPSDHTIDDYKDAAKQAGGSSAPDEIGGGVFGAVSDSGSDSSTTTASDGSSASATTTATDSAATETDSSSASMTASGASATASDEATSASSAAAASATSGDNGAGNVGAPVGVMVAVAAGVLAML